MTRGLHRAWRKAVRKGRVVYVMSDERGWHELLAQRKGCRLLAIVGMRADGGPEPCRPRRSDPPRARCRSSGASADHQRDDAGPDAER